MPGSNVNSTTARQRQEGAVQAFKIANEAASYLNGNLAEHGTGKSQGKQVAPGPSSGTTNKRQAAPPGTNPSQSR